jgi:hypothetical protein
VGHRKGRRECLACAPILCYLKHACHGCRDGHVGKLVSITQQMSRVLKRKQQMKRDYAVSTQELPLSYSLSEGVARNIVYVAPSSLGHIAHVLT